MSPLVERSSRHRHRNLVAEGVRKEQERANLPRDSLTPPQGPVSGSPIKTRGQRQAPTPQPTPQPTQQRTLRSRQPPTQPQHHTTTTRQRPRSQSPEAPALVTGAGSSRPGPVSDSGASFVERHALGGTDSLSHLPRAVTTTRFGSAEGMGPRRADQLGTAVVTVAMQAASAFHPNGGVVLQAALTGQAANDEHGASEHDRHTTRTNRSS